MLKTKRVILPCISFVVILVFLFTAHLIQNTLNTNAYYNNEGNLELTDDTLTDTFSYLEQGFIQTSVEIETSSSSFNNQSVKESFTIEVDNKGEASYTLDSGVYFPLSIEGIGGRNIQYANYNYSPFSNNITKITSFTKTPTIWGITPVNVEVTIAIDKPVTITLPDGTKNTTYDFIASYTTTANANSQWGVNITTPLSSGTYRITTSATRYDDYTQLPEMKLVVY